MIGTRLAHFEIVDKLGEGGMGEVYRARDTRLGREVAIKVLPGAFVADPERLGRFEREARALASLQHPSVAAIHEVGEEDGHHFLVMELASGEDLAERLRRGPIPPGEALPIALRIAEALEAAHGRGIVHRDLKPSNVMVDAEGAVKVLDFGLARALEREDGSPSSASLAHSPTMTLGATVAGTLLGTAAYMSPEQAAGRSADGRADVWAFGVVLFEMLTGRPVFDGETVSHLLAAVLRDEPPWGRLPRDLPRRLRELLERCLRRDPQRRLQAIGDARILLQEALESPDGDAPEAAREEHRRGASRIAWAVAGLATLAALGLLLLRPTVPSATDGPRVLRLELPLPEGQVKLALNHQFDAIALSPDGIHQAFLVADETGRQRLAVRSLDEIRGRVLDGTEGASSPFFSPDGQSLAYVAQGRLWQRPVRGGPPSPIAEIPDDNRGASWSPDGYIYAPTATAVALHRVRATGGIWEPIAELDGSRRERTHRWPHAVPDGSAVLFTSDTQETTEYYDDARIEAIRPDTGERKVVVEGASRAWVLPSGHLLYARAGAVFASPFDPERLETTGPPVVVLQGVSTTVASGVVHLSVSRNGSLLYLPGTARTARDVVWVDREGRVEPTPVGEGNWNQLALGPDGRRAALVTVDTGRRLVWIVDLESGARTRLTFQDSAADPAWSPDGEWLFYDGPEGLHRQRTDGSGQPELLVESVLPTFPDSVSPDGRTLVFSPDLDSGQSDIFALDLESGGPPVPLVSTPTVDWHAEVSPDGRWLAYVSNESGRPQVYVQPFDGGSGRWQVSTDSGFEPHWSADGRELFFRTNLGTVQSVEVGSDGAFTAGPAVLVFRGLYTGDSPATYSPAPDGERFLVLGLAQEGHADRVVLVLGWGAEVDELTGPR